MALFTNDYVRRARPVTTLAIDHPRIALHRGGPTPVRQLSEHLWLKDDGCFGDGGWGGNKVRKLEWLLGRAKHDGVQRILTFGGRGTNWGLATALYARAIGIEKRRSHSSTSR